MSDGEGLRVTRTIEGANPTHPKYPLLTGDLLMRHPDGTYMKVAPGIAVGGFTLTEQQAETLNPVRFTCRGLDYSVSPEPEAGA